jgi:hypothetical protein
MQWEPSEWADENWSADVNGIIPEAGNGILAENMTVAYNISTGRWTAGWLATQLAVIDPDSPLGMSQDGKFLIVFRPVVASTTWQ